MHGKQILLVEDDLDVRTATAILLRNEGYRVIEAEHGEEALRQLRRSGDWCLIILDLFMPVMNGWEFRRSQLSDGSLASIPVVVVSADQNAEDTGAELGAVEAITKPIDFKRLLRAIADHC